MTAPRAARVETPADVLRRAAAKVRADAVRATPGPWRCEQGSDEASGIGAYEWWAVTDADETDVASVTIRRADQGNAEWIALLSPAVAEPLATWLDSEAAHAELREGSLLNPEITRPVEALALARVLLGSPVPEPDGEGT